MKPVSVTQVNQYLSKKFDGDMNLRDIVVIGELSNVRNRGHVYLNLKDDNSVIGGIIWQSTLSRIDTSLLTDGRNVIVVGTVRVYGKGGTYSIHIHHLEDAGAGKAQAAFEELKKKLQAEGLFDTKYKKPLPQYPRRVGIITSEEGDALRDIKKIITKKNQVTDILIFPAYVQGVQAPESLCQMIRKANEVHRTGEYAIDVLIIGRGGGSKEDLAAFNDERVARAIFHSDIPIISAVGHEPDVSISDYVADRRAATPSEAAEIAVPDTNELLLQIRNQRNEMLNNLRSKAMSERRIIDQSIHLLHANMKTRLRDARLAVERARITLQEGHPSKILDKGYAAVMDEMNHIVSDIEDIRIGDAYTVRLKNGSFQASVIGKETSHESKEF